MTRARTLVLWDIDHTLIDTAGLGPEIYRTIFPQVTGVPLRELPTMHGRTELGIAYDALARHDLPESPDTARHMLAALAEEFHRRADELRDRASVLPGVEAALALADGRDDTVQSLVTGNVEEVARLKMEVTGLSARFRWGCGGFGEDDRERSRLVRRARERAGADGGPVGRVVVVGDTPNDVAAALAEGAHAVGVATGRFSAEDLHAAGAHAVLPDLSDTDRVRDALGVA